MVRTLEYLTICFLFVFVVISCSKTEPNKYNLSGNVFGTTFHITYVSFEEKVSSKQLDSLFYLVNKSLSTYIPNSDISRINKNELNTKVDTLFKEVFGKAHRIYKETDGVFDPTIGILVNAWGFGPNKNVEKLDSLKIKNLLKYVGFDKVSISEDIVYKKFPESYFDFNAIAKGFGVDVVGRFFEMKSVENYLVEIGGEVRARGKNSEHIDWRVGVEQPNFDGSRGIQKILSLKNESMATSGNYRKFKIDSLTGEKYVHTIDTKTGFTAKRDLLSATVISSLDCADVDGYATTFMAMGYKKTLDFLKAHPELKVFLIYVDKKGEVKEYLSDSLSSSLL
ncbi:FAD:protein FMN transferase [Flavicella sediminum]|uniref:FAD:protein FMN transferase n=1 Tax=Flavicella sediminum TaxID=2585141 RepID=UPI00111D0ED2|nr:FAD:protein FMN transferase [Flavicella sediminum]